jgi:methyl-accepting chemotaxis protein
MNPDRNKGGMTVNALMQTGMFLSTAVAVIAIAALGFIASGAISSEKLSTNTFYLIVMFCAIVVVLGIFFTHYAVQRKIKDRLLSLVDVCRDYAGGDRTVRVTVNGDDEFAMLSMSLNTLLDTQGNMANGVVALGGNSGDASALQAQIEKLLQEVSAVGDGDLRVQAEVTPDTLGVLADSFNYMIEELAKVVGRVQSTAVQVTNAARRILDRSADLAQATETQVEQIEQATHAVGALASFIQDVAQSAQRSVDVSQEALRNATTGQKAVRQTIEGMMQIRENVQETSKKIKRLGERSNEIGEIVRIIDDIADQTNLLALNAAIQSAMAGEHGRGFAVVADEIRLLAERSTESTKRIATLVKSIQGDTYEAVVAMEDSTQEVVKGSQLADEAGRALNTIYGAVERQAKLIEGIAHSAQQQASVSDAVAAAMSQIQEITRQTDAGMQEGAVNVSYLADLAEQLRASVSTFRLPEHAEELTGPFAPVPSISEFAESNNNGFMPALPAGDGGWGHDFANNFSPLGGSGNSDSLVALTARQGQYPFGQQEFAGFDERMATEPQHGYGQGFGGQQGFGNGQDFGFGSDARFDAQPGFGNNGNGQPAFGNFGSYATQQQNLGPTQGALPNAPGMAYPPASSSNPMSAKPTPPRQRWQAGGNPAQATFGQDQGPFSKNG